MAVIAEALAADKPLTGFGPWLRVDKGDVRCRLLADEHYTRQHPGAPMWTRPGFNFVLYAETDPWHGVGTKAVFCWWRPKWEDGQERGDGLRALECTIFRLTPSFEQGGVWLASDLVAAAVAALASEDARHDLSHSEPDGLMLITGVGTQATARRRSRRHKAGHCFREAGWVELPHRVGRADCWLTLPVAA